MMPPKLPTGTHVQTSHHDTEIDCGLGVLLKTEVHVYQHPADSDLVLGFRQDLNADANAAEILSTFGSPVCSVPLGSPCGYCTDECLWRFLIANGRQIAGAKKQLLAALELRKRRRPDLCLAKDIENETLTGKIYRPGWDAWGRPVLVFNNTKENTRSVDNQMLHLAWNLECATRTMEGDVEKYVVFIHLEEFSLFGAPPIAATQETIKQLTTCFAERLGHCVVYRPPKVFEVFFNMVKSLIDPKTVSKMVFVTGDVSDGSANDQMLRKLIADDWKVLCGAEQPVYDSGCSPGFKHSEYWPTVLEEERLWQEACSKIQPREEQEGIEQKQLDFEIRSIAACDTVSIREQVLWPGKPEKCSLPEDDQGLHFGAFSDGTLVGVISAFQSGDSMQFRKFAVLSSHQRRGIGTQLLLHVASICTERKAARLWCDARHTQQELYEKRGMTRVGDPYEKYAGEGILYVKMEMLLN